MDSKKYIASLDVGTTTVRCFIFTKDTEIVGLAVENVKLLHPQPGFVEIDPSAIFEASLSVIRNAVKDAELVMSDIECLGISTQRASFTIWSSETGRPFCNIITWMDMRADSLVKKINHSLKWKVFNLGAKMLYLLTCNKRYLTGSVLKMTNIQVTCRLLWVIENIPGIADAINNGTAMFGTLDTWLLYKLTNGKSHLTDYSNAASTGFFDPFTLKWANWAVWILSVPESILPTVVNTSGDFGCIDSSLLGHPIPIRSLAADQSAAMFGSCSFNESDLKLTLGTGSFISVHTGSSPHASFAGIYPLVGWKVGKEVAFMAEGSTNDTGTLVTWAQHLGFIQTPAESAAVAKSVPDSDGVYFIPSFSGLQVPINDATAATGFIGLKPTSSKSHMTRAILESIAFRVCQIFYALQRETRYGFKKIKIDGGVSQNDFIAQLISDLSMMEVERAKSVEMSALGAAYLAGLETGFWSNRQELETKRQINKCFYPRKDEHEMYKKHMNQWEAGVRRFLRWYEADNSND